MRKTDPIGVPRHAALFVLAMGLIFAGMLVLNVLTPLQADDYDYLVVNDDIKTAVWQVQQIMRIEKGKED